MTDIVERLRKLAEDLIALDIDMRLPPGSLNPHFAADEIERLRLSISEARATGYREAYEVRMKKFRSGCACHINDSDEIVSMCQHHEALVAEARATGRREGLSKAANVADAASKEWEADAALWHKEGMLKTAASSLMHSEGAAKVAAAIRAAMEK